MLESQKRYLRFTVSTFRDDVDAVKLKPARSWLRSIRLVFILLIGLFFLFVGFGGNQPDRAISLACIVFGVIIFYVEFSVLRAKADS